MDQRDEQKMREIARQEIQNAASKSQFAVRDVALHTHNGVDAPFAFQPQMVYAGLIIEDGTPALLPASWTVEHVSTGTYHIIHNLGVALGQYVATVSPILSTSAPVPSVLPFPDLLEVTWYDTITAGFRDTTFQFIMLNTTNRAVAPQKYYVAP
jgi:hypothetical protein